jgi:3-oxoacyl-(acyl-carrier-protein) synthase
LNPILVQGVGAVSPAGWGVPALHQAVSIGTPLPAQEMPRPGSVRPWQVRRVPPPSPRPTFLAHPRLRRTSPITHFLVAAALEAIGEELSAVRSGALRLGVVMTTMIGCVNYSRRFYDETLKDPTTASPLVFPETVFNAPASHLAAFLGTRAINYTLVGDPGTFLQGLAAAADWLLQDRVDGCLVLGAEECDWLAADAYRLFSRGVVLSEGAGALYLRAGHAASSAIRLAQVTHPALLFRDRDRRDAMRRVRGELPLEEPAGLLCDSRQGATRVDAPETEAWADWPGPRLSPKSVLGEGLTAASAWQCVLAVERLRHQPPATATVSVLGCNEQAIAARFTSAFV